jgi:ribosomal 50S subunit-associated protein YjgA (DUF615 family)
MRPETHHLAEVQALQALEGVQHDSDENVLHSLKSWREAVGLLYDGNSAVTMFMWVVATCLEVEARRRGLEV